MSSDPLFFQLYCYFTRFFMELRQSILKILPNVLGSKWHSTIFAIKIQHYSNFRTNTLPFQVKANKIRSMAAFCGGCTYWLSNQCIYRKPIACKSTVNFRFKEEMLYYMEVDSSTFSTIYLSTALVKRLIGFLSLKISHK